MLDLQGGLIKNGSGTLELQSAPTFRAGSSVTVADDGELRVNVAAGSAQVLASGISVTVGSTACARARWHSFRVDRLRE